VDQPSASSARYDAIFVVIPALASINIDLILPIHAGNGVAALCLTARKGIPSVLLRHDGVHLFNEW
jgi:hypothetical protein